MALKHTQAEIDLITDPDMYLMIEADIRGGIATISGRYAKANNPLLPDYDPQKPTSYIICLDANNLYEASQSESLSVGDFRFLSEQEIADFKLESVSQDSPTGYIISCDLEYPDYLHEPHSDYPLAPEHLTIHKDKLSRFAQNLAGENWIPTKKLIPNLQDKKNYVVHYRNLQFYVDQGLKVTKIHKILLFPQRPWLKPWIDLCISQRKNAKSNFEADLVKL